MRALILVLASCLLLSLPAENARAVDGISVEATRRDDALEVVCRAVLDAPLELIWQTLTDYGRLADFIPGMRKSRVVEQRGGAFIVEQSGVATFLFVSTPIEVTLAATERPPYAIDVTMVKGNLKRLDGAYRIEPQGGGRMLLSWDGVVEAQSMPPLLGELVMRSNIEEQFRGMVREIERRDALRRDREREVKR
jgi:carbon monoxide dehydrogenase subunit G